MNHVARRLIAKCTDKIQPPYIAVLGPPGAGKTLLLRAVFRKLSADASVTPLYINLREISLNSESEMQAQLNDQLTNKFVELNGTGADSLRRMPGANFADILQLLCGHSRRRIILFMDQFDSVPHFFSRSISRQIRQIYEKAATHKPLSELGVVIAGVLSVFHLKRETDSAFTFFSTEALPPNPLAERVSAIEDQFPRGLKLPRKAAEWLANYCGPDPSFLKAIIEKLKTNSKGRPKTILALSRFAKNTPSGHNVLKELSIHLWKDPYLFEIAKELLESDTPVPVHEPVVDVPLFQLLGMVRVENDCYVFRSESVRNHVAEIRDVIAQLSPCLVPQQLIRLQGKPGGTPGAYDIVMLESCKRSLMTSNNIGDIKRILIAIWRILRSGEEPNIEISSNPASVEPIGERHGADLTALEAAVGLKRPCFGWDSNRVSLCVPLTLAKHVAYVTTTLLRSELQGDFSESALSVWIRLLADVKIAVVAHSVLTEVAVEMSANESWSTMKPSQITQPTVAHRKALKVLEEVLVQLAFDATDPLLFVRDMVERAQLEHGIRIAALRNVSGMPDSSVRKLLLWAFHTGSVPDDPATPLIQRLVVGVFDDLGVEQRRLILAALLQLPLHVNSSVELMAAEFGVPVPAVTSALIKDGPAIDNLQPEDQLQSYLRRPVEFLDVGFLNKALERASSVCMISVPQTGSFGSGVLIGEELVLTNYHVLGTNGDITAAAAQAIVQIGFTSEAPGAICSLSNTPLVAFSPTNALDYVLLRLSCPRKGGLQVASARDYRPKTAVHILQHPSGESMKLSLSHNGLVGVDLPAGRMRYVTTTAGGSSGAPCFDESWNLIAIHRSEKSTGFGSVREGILLDAILANAKL